MDPMDDVPDRPVRFGLVGAGPWAARVHAPAIAAHQDTELVAVWARRPEAADAIARQHGAAVATDVDALFADVDAVAFAVPPSVQAELAGRAAAAGRHLVLDKPVAGTAAEAERLADAVTGAGVGSAVMLTLRYAPEVIEWVTTARTAGGWATGNVTWYGGALLAGPYSTSPWRQERGGLLDVGPHVFDLLDAALGPIEDVLAATHGDHDVWHVLLAHENGVRSTVSVSSALPIEKAVGVTLYGKAGRLALPEVVTPAEHCYARLLTDLVALVRAGRPGHPLDVRHGLRLQRLIERAERLALA
jgi:predicted dehydrogenase